MKMLFPKATEAELATAQMMPPKEGMKYLADNQKARSAPPTANTNLAKAKIDLQNGLITQQQYDAMVKAEGMNAGGKPPAPVLNFARRQQLVAEYGEGSPEVLRFDNYVRASQYGNTGSAIIQHNPANPTEPTVVAPTTLKP